MGWGPAGGIAAGGVGWDDGVAIGFRLVCLLCQGCDLLFGVLGTHASYCQNVACMFSTHHMW